MTNHELKTWPAFFRDLQTGAKTAEVRRNDRNFAVGDMLVMVEWDPILQMPTGRSEHRRVACVSPLDSLGIAGHVLLSFTRETS